MTTAQEQLAKMRQQYLLASLREEDMEANPFQQFEKWFAEAVDSGMREPNAMALATAGADGQPSVRIVLLKGFTEEGFSFFTNYQSEKSQQIAENPKASALMLWHELERQVRIEGPVERLTTAESDAYFASRPRGSQLGAWISPQSQVVTRDQLEQLQQEVEAKFDGQDIPRPKHWGGFRIVPERVEFWQGRPNRLHDRLVYSKEGHQWVLRRLAP